MLLIRRMVEGVWNFGLETVIECAVLNGLSCALEKCGEGQVKEDWG